MSGKKPRKTPAEAHIPMQKLLRLSAQLSSCTAEDLEKYQEAFRRVSRYLPSDHSDLLLLRAQISRLQNLVDASTKSYEGLATSSGSTEDTEYRNDSDSPSAEMPEFSLDSHWTLDKTRSAEFVPELN